MRQTSYLKETSSVPQDVKSGSAEKDTVGGAILGNPFVQSDHTVAVSVQSAKLNIRGVTFAEFVCIDDAVAIFTRYTAELAM